jgi:DNA polymerase-3 subunit alpha
MLAFSNTLKEHGGYLAENRPIVVVGRLSLRDDKEPQIVINRVRPMSDYAQSRGIDITQDVPVVSKPKILYLRLPTEDDRLFAKVRSILSMFPGEESVVVYFADTKVRKGSRCAVAESMVEELIRVLGEENVVVK